MKKFQTLAELAACVGQEVAVSDWLTITQEKVNLFAEATVNGYISIPSVPKQVLLVAQLRTVF
jgi:hypothetical protein